MPIAYAWDVRVRLDPVNGDDTSLNLSTLLTDAGGPNSVELDYRPDIVQRETVNHRRFPYVRGYRLFVALHMEIVAMADQATLAQISNALVDREQDVYLSLDGGATERRVSFVSRQGPIPLGGFTHVGARYVLAVQAVDLIQEEPAIGSGSW
jgi:hypothetical protein